ncbi:MAG: hypothetical protein ABI678_09540 [Kofleriaceae bacterium]
MLWGVLACAVAPACGSKDSAPAAQPGAVAGKVLEVSGSVNVGGKPLAAGDPVKTDDTIVTGADGHVAIELAHNGARWELGPNHKGRPMDAPVWSAAKRDKAASVDQDTSAAGRPAERSAAENAASAAQTGAPKGGGAPEADRARAVEAPTAPPPPAAASAETRPVPPPPPPPPPPREVRALDAAGEGGGGSRAGDVKQAPRPPSTLTSLSTCLPAGTKLQIKVHIANHVPAITFATEPDPVVKQCITDAAKKMSLVVTSGDLELTLSR